MEMRRRATLIATVVVSMLASGAGFPIQIGVTAAQAQDPGFWSFLKEGQTIRRCTPMSAAHLEAKVSLARLGDQMERLATSDPLDPALKELHRLLRTECFLMASEAGRVPTPDSTRSLREWWSSGGEEWLASYLELPRYGEVSALRPHVVIPPDTRRTLDLETARGHRLQSLLCSQRDAACGARTRGWVLRTDVQFSSWRPPDWKNDADVRKLTPEEASRECVATAGQNYQAWRTCVESKRRTRTVLPLGAFRAPQAGWLVIAGRRGHYDFCDTTRAYDLETGTAFMSDSCSGLALQPDGGVNAPQTNKQRKQTVRSGSVSLDNLREAVWMMVFEREAADVQLTAEAVPLPAGMTPEITIRHQTEDSGGLGVSWNSGQTLLVWRWISTAQTRFDGELTWPGSDKAAEDHAANLLNVAEESFVEGCPRRSPPASASIRARQPVNRVDAPTDSVDKWLDDAIPQWRAIPICR